MSFNFVNPKSLGAPRGFSHGTLGPAGGRTLFIAGQVGLDAGSNAPPDFATQFARALDNVLAVVREAGGEPRDIGRLTLYVLDLAAYRASRPRLGEAWRSRFGSYYPAMAVLEVRGLVDAGAVLEIEATAVLGGNR